MRRKRRYITVAVDVDVDINQFETEDLIGELERRWEELTTEEKKKMLPYVEQGWQPQNLDHQMKFELFLKHIDDYFLDEFEKRLTAPWESIRFKDWKDDYMEFKGITL